MKRIVLATAAALLAAAPVPATAGGGCHYDAPESEVATTEVVVDHACFGPVVARVTTGATVTWRNVSGMPHNISGPTMDYAELPDGATHAVTFTEPGLYPYACMLHAGMSGVVRVVDGPTAAAVADESGAGLPAGAVWGGAALVAAAGGVLVARRSPRPARVGRRHGTQQQARIQA